MTKARKISARVFSWQQKGKIVLAYFIFPVLYVYKDMHYFFLVSMSSSSSAPVNVFSWSYPAVTEHYKVFHASMRKSINQLVLRAHDTYRWHGSGFRPRSAYSKLSVNMKKSIGLHYQLYRFREWIFYCCFFFKLTFSCDHRCYSDFHLGVHHRISYHNKPWFSTSTWNVSKYAFLKGMEDLCGNLLLASAFCVGSTLKIRVKILVKQHRTQCVFNWSKVSGITKSKLK